MDFEAPKSPLPNFEGLETEFEVARTQLLEAISESSVKLSDMVNQDLDGADRLLKGCEGTAERLKVLVRTFETAVADHEQKVGPGGMHDKLIRRLEDLISDGRKLLDRKDQLGREIEHYKK